MVHGLVEYCAWCDHGGSVDRQSSAHWPSLGRCFGLDYCGGCIGSPDPASEGSVLSRLTKRASVPPPIASIHQVNWRARENDARAGRRGRPHDHRRRGAANAAPAAPVEFPHTLSVSKTFLLTTMGGRDDKRGLPRLSRARRKIVPDTFYIG